MSQSRMKSLTKPCTSLAYYSSRWLFLSSEALLSSCHKQRVQHVSVCVRLGLSVSGNRRLSTRCLSLPTSAMEAAFVAESSPTRVWNERIRVAPGCLFYHFFFSLSLTSSTYSSQVFRVTVASDLSQWHTHSAALLWTKERSIAETRFFTSKQNQMFVDMAECAASIVPLYKYVR